MFVHAKLLSLVFLAAAALGVNAQSNTTSSADAAASALGVTPCILSCSTQAASEHGCSSFADLQCVCTNTAFQAAAQACLQANCTAAELTAALGLQTQECATIVGASSASGSTATSGSAESTSSAAAPASSPSAAASSTNTHASSASTHSSASSASPASNSASGGSSTSAPAPASNTAGTSSGAPSTTTTGNAAAALRLDFDGMMGLSVAVAGVLAGAGLLL